MKISVVIPTYNSARFIRGTLESVLRQTTPPDEILVLDDGSTDNTLSVLETFGSRIVVFQQKNQGVAHARNVLCQRARGDLIAFLDHDDVWHPTYLEVQERHSERYPDAVAFFTGHVDFSGYGNYEWRLDSNDDSARVEVLDPLVFFKRYDHNPGVFGSASFLCIPKQALTKMGNQPFCEEVSGADDLHLCYVFPLMGPVVYTAAPLVAYRITREALSANLLKNCGLTVESFQLLENRYREAAEARLSEAFGLAFAQTRRRYGKALMGAGRTLEAREQFRLSLRNAKIGSSLAKSVSLLCMATMASALHVKWPSHDHATRSAVNGTSNGIGAP